MKKVSVEHLQRFMQDTLHAVGLEFEQAKITANHMVFADCQGTDTHGILRLPVYIERIQRGLINKTPNLTWEKETSNSAVLNADNAIGHYATHLAMEKAIVKAKKNAVSFVTLYNGNHFGALAAYTKMAADENLIGFITTNTTPLMAPTGGAERVIGNNPLSFAVPREGDDPVILDIACTNVAVGKLVLANKKGEKIPIGWALDKNGKPTTDPYEGFEGGGILLPIGGHKGYGLALLMDILTGVLSGANYGKNVSQISDMTKVTGLGCSMMVLNIERFMPMEQFHERLEDLLNMVLTSKKAEGVDRIYLPGEIEKETREQRTEEGIGIPDKLHQELLDIAADLNIKTDQYGL